MTAASFASLSVVLGAGATPSPAPATGIDPSSVSPGLVGFLATFALVAVCILLFINMSRRLRRMRYRGLQEEQRERDEQRAAQDAAADDSSDRTGDDAREDAGDDSSDDTGDGERRS